MKTLRFLLVMMFMLTLFVSPAQAQGGTIGFIALVAQSDSAAPLAVQARDAFRILQPELKAAQQNGTLLNFEPNFYEGIVRVEFAGALPAQIAGKTVFGDIYAAIAAVQPASTQDVSAQAYDPHFDITLYNYCLSASGLLSGYLVKAGLYDPSGHLLTTSSGIANGSGIASVCFYYSYTYYLYPGYKLIIKVYDTLNVLLDTYPVTIPSVTFTAFNNAKSIVSGKGPAGKAFDINWYHENLNALNTTINMTKPGMITPGKLWSKDFSNTIKFRRDDYFEITVKQSPRFFFTRQMYIPSAYCRLGDNYCELYGFPNQPGQMTLTHAGVPYIFTGIFDNEISYGTLYPKFTNSSGFPVFVKAGDKISGTGVATYTVPSLTASVNHTNSSVFGKAPANRYFNVSLSQYDAGTYIGSWVVWAHSNSAGNYVADFDPMTDIPTTSTVYVTVRYQDPINGNFTRLYKNFMP